MQGVLLGHNILKLGIDVKMYFLLQIIACRKQRPSLVICLFTPLDRVPTLVFNITFSRCPGLKGMEQKTQVNRRSFSEDTTLQADAQLLRF